MDLKKASALLSPHASETPCTMHGTAISPSMRYLGVAEDTHHGPGSTCVRDVLAALKEETNDSLTAFHFLEFQEARMYGIVLERQ